MTIFSVFSSVVKEFYISSFFHLLFVFVRHLYNSYTTSKYEGSTRNNLIIFSAVRLPG